MLKNENQNDLIEIVDSDDEIVQSNRHEMIPHNVESVDENGSNASTQGCNDDENEDIFLPMVTFDPNCNIDEIDAVTSDVASTPRKCLSGKSRKSRP